MSLALTDTQLDDWIAQHGEVPPGYGDFKRFLFECDAQYQAVIDDLKARLAAPGAPKLLHVPGQGLSDCPF
jgi:hypothetical protein